MGLIDRVFVASINRRADHLAAERIKQVQAQIPELIQSELSKAYDTPGSLAMGLQRYGQDFSLYDKSLRTKPQTSVSFEMMRRFAVSNEIVRACINARKRQLTQLEWDVVPTDATDRTDYSKDVADIRLRMRNIGGYKTRLRELFDVGVEDLLVLDALSWYKQRNAKGELISLIPVDAATITLRVDEAGNTPLPPEAAFKQIIRGQVVAEMTADEMIYEMMNPRSSSPYGLSPIESLVLVISSMLRSELYNLNYLTDGNIPEGFYHLPEGWSPQMIQEFQQTWDAYLAGDPRATSKMRFMPGGTGTGFTPAKKPEDMAFKEFNTWLMEVICAMFDIPPQELGFTEHQSTRANAQTQFDITMRRSLIPLANFFCEIFNDLVQEEFGFPHLQFKFLGLEDRDQLQEAQVQQIHVQAGIRTIDEVRKDELGLDPIGINEPIIVGAGAVSVRSVLAGDTTEGDPTDENEPASAGQNDNGSRGAELKPGQDKPQSVDASKPNVPNSGKIDYASVADELRKMKTFAVGRIRDGKTLRPFTSAVLPQATLDALNEQVTKCASAFEVRGVFRDFMQADQIEFLAEVQDLRNGVVKLLEAA